MQFSNRLGVVASGTTVRIDEVDATTTGNVAVGATETVTVTPPLGWIYIVRAMLLSADAPIGATAGTHYWDLVASVGASKFNVLHGEASFGKRCRWEGVGWTEADAMALPASPAAEAAAITYFPASPTTPLTLEYTNDTDAIQTVDRTVLLVLQRLAV